MNERILLIRKYLNLTQKEFSHKIGLSHGTLSDIEKNKIPIQERHIISICAVFNVNPEWLRYGNGNMFNSSQSYDEFYTIYQNLSPILQKFLLNTAKGLLENKE